METDYERRLRETVEKIQARSSVRTEKYDRGPLAVYMERAEDALEIIRIVEEIPLSAELTRNFHRHSSLLFAWRALDPFEAIAGEFHIVHIAEAMLRGARTSPIYPATPEEERLVEASKIFETHPVGGTGTYSALRLTRNQDSPEIWYFDIRQGPTRLHISYGDYLDVMLRTKGLYGWQYLFAKPDPDNYGMCVSLPYLRDGLDFLAHEFPDDDLSDLRAKLEERMRITGEES
ncbi:hypothetical protein Misp01_83530 [Microtetraspora sp. NBRC 13810]|uniref:hypothetical protein n=1 Tax=Microtetraspora sp. NBRC 13810 TaxID=3030990 RepID=UPI0024A57C88|nr:hypothetical protein [Microtetraspora sp. NBRC 13810]GLW13225.1 hypothetical protein Misp01_83530 [Microtetraspora sp. NBRC 13810]